MPLDLTDSNDKIKAWGARFLAFAKAKGSAMGITHRAGSPSPVASLSKMKDKYRQANGITNKISFTFPRTLVYTMTGSGKGIGGAKGSRWVNAKGEQKKTDPKSKNKIGRGNRTPKKFIDEALDSNHGLEELADIVAEGYGDAIVSNILTT